jgi:hypothetical protein
LRNISRKLTSREIEIEIEIDQAEDNQTKSMANKTIENESTLNFDLINTVRTKRISQQI